MIIIEIYPLDKQISVAIKILKLLEVEQVTFFEFGFINTLINDSINCQKENIENVIYCDEFYECKICKSASADNEVIRYTGDG